MKKLNLLMQGCTLTVIMGFIFSANAQPNYNQQQQAHQNYYRTATISNYGLINPGQQSTFSIPQSARPGSMGVCWSRNLVAGKIKLEIPNYGAVLLTPANPVARFSIPSGGVFSVKYPTKHGLFRRRHSNYAPAQLMCKF